MIDPALLVAAPAGLTALVWGVTSWLKRNDYVPPTVASDPYAGLPALPAVTGEVIRTVTAEVVRPPALAAAARAPNASTTAGAAQS